jgi:hypothetical protein
MTPLGYLYTACVLFILGCWSLTFFLRRRIRVHTVHRDSIFFPESTFLCADLVLGRQPATGVSDPAQWCTDCGWQGEMGHAADCPRVTGQRCPRCDKPKRAAHVCHYCGFAGFVIVFDFAFSPARKRRLVSDAPAKPANQAKDGSLSCEDFESDRRPEL